MKETALAIRINTPPTATFNFKCVIGFSFGFGVCHYNGRHQSKENHHVCLLHHCSRNDECVASGAVEASDRGYSAARERKAGPFCACSKNGRRKAGYYRPLEAGSRICCRYREGPQAWRCPVPALGGSA